MASHFEQLEDLKKLCIAEGWAVDEDLGEDGAAVITDTGKLFPLLHPYSIYLRLYRDEKDPFTKLKYMKKVHDFLWPGYIPTWNTWEEERFLAHCNGYNQIVLAGGASVAKSLTAAKIAVIFYLSDPKRNACIIASTTLESLESRIWGYVAKLVNSTAIPIPVKIMTGKPPKIVLKGQVDKIHGMFAVAIRQGEDDTVLSTLIGRHPDKGLMIVLDEATDMNPAITKALPNLEKGVEKYQVIAIGNSNSKNDLHGALATPKKGWDSIDPERDRLWQTTHKNGVCLYCHPRESPAITDPDPEKRERLAKFLPTLESIAEDESRYGKESSSYWRFVLGFWKSQSIDNVIISEQFCQDHRIYERAYWSGLNDLEVVAGLDPAFQVGGTGCVLRLAVMGQSIDGKIKLDFWNEELLFKIDIKVDTKKSGELQLAEQVVEILRKYKCPVRNMAIDATGVGRALGELIRLVSGETEAPYRIVSTRFRTQGGSTDPNILVQSPSDLWMRLRDFVQQGQIKGLDFTTIGQITNRLVFLKNNKLILETKSEYKTRMAAINPRLSHSPDEADAAILAVTAAVLRYGFFPGQYREVRNYSSETDSSVVQKIRVFSEERRLIEAAPSVNTRPRINNNFLSGLDEKFR